MTLSLSGRVKHLKGSATLALAANAKALRSAGKPVLDFSAGEPDFPTPDSIKRAAVQAIERNQTKYTPAAGIPELRAAIATVLRERLSVAYQSSQVIVSCGAKHALYNAVQALCQDGDEVLLLSPYWVSYPAMIQMAGGQVVVVETRAATQFQPNPQAIRKAITKRTKAIILNSPSNPTGAVLEPACLKAIARVALTGGLAVISDEIYDQLVFPPQRAWSLLQVAPQLAGQTIVVNGVSKTYSMTGWRIGYAAGPQTVIDAMGALQSHSTSNPTSISQYAALAALAAPLEEIATMRHEFQRRRDRLVNGLNRIRGLSCFLPHGAFYAWCDVSQLGQSASMIAARWLEDTLVVVVPGEEFGSSAHVRFSFATSMDVIDEGLARLQRWVERPGASSRRAMARRTASKTAKRR